MTRIITWWSPLLLLAAVGLCEACRTQDGLDAKLPRRHDSVHVFDSGRSADTCDANTVGDGSAPWDDTAVDPCRYGLEEWPSYDGDATADAVLDDAAKGRWRWTTCTDRILGRDIIAISVRYFLGDYEAQFDASSWDPVGARVTTDNLKYCCHTRFIAVYGEFDRYCMSDADWDTGQLPERP